MDPTQRHTEAASPPGDLTVALLGAATPCLCWNGIWKVSPFGTKQGKLEKPSFCCVPPGNVVVRRDG